MRYRKCRSTVSLLVAKSVATLLVSYRYHAALCVDDQQSLSANKRQATQACSLQVSPDPAVLTQSRAVQAAAQTALWLYPSGATDWLRRCASCSSPLRWHPNRMHSGLRRLRLEESLRACTGNHKLKVWTDRNGFGLKTSQH